MATILARFSLAVVYVVQNALIDFLINALWVDYVECLDIVLNYSKVDLIIKRYYHQLGSVLP